MKKTEKFEKITDEMCYDEKSNIQDHLTEKVKHSLIGNISDYEIGQCDSLINCESPIEQLLSLEMDRLGIELIYLFNPAIDVLGMTRQAEIVAGNHKYRADFLIEVHYKHPKDTLVKFVIECDGFDYHSSKAQMKNDYARTRALQESGYEVIKFTGSEIYLSACRCARSVLRAMVNKSEILKLNKA